MAFKYYNASIDDYINALLSVCQFLPVITKHYKLIMNLSLFKSLNKIFVHPMVLFIKPHVHKHLSQVVSSNINFVTYSTRFKLYLSKWASHSILGSDAINASTYLNLVLYFPLVGEVSLCCLHSSQDLFPFQPQVSRCVAFVHDF